MPLQTDDFLQADKLEQVGQVALAVAEGNHSDGTIEAYIHLASDGRQGRYYRHAAEKLGLITNESNFARLTLKGEEFSRLAGPKARLDYLARCLVETPVFIDALRYIDMTRPSRAQLRLWHRNVFPGSSETADRRFSTLMNYLLLTRLIEESGGTYDVAMFAGAVRKIELPSSQALIGVGPASAAPAFVQSGVMRVDVDLQKRERASTVHWRLVDAKASFLLRKGYEALANGHIDLFARNAQRVVIYEMKSVNQEGTNLLSQLRRSVSQLYEYRFIYNQPQAALCVVTNSPIPYSSTWLTSYLTRDRLIAYEWTEDFREFHSAGDSSRVLLDLDPT